MKSTFTIRCAATLMVLATCAAKAAPKAASETESKTWTDPATALQEDPDFAIQGEYQGCGTGVQVVALGDGHFDAYVLAGGLPGAGWTPDQQRLVLHGARAGDKLTFADDAGKTSAVIENGVLSLVAADGKASPLPRIERHSPTLGAKSPTGAIVLFDGNSADAWENGKSENGLLLATGSSTKQHFTDYKLHLEFRTPYKPTARGQQRGNSGVYQSGRWETQILDSFGLKGEEDQTGGIYSISKPLLNMCLPPLTWQTYDVDFTAATFDASGKRTAWPRITVKLNGVVVQENKELNKDFTTSAPTQTPLISPDGPINLQYHNNPVVFRNIWIVPGKPSSTP